METLEERRHQYDMQQVYRILTGKDKVNKDHWFQLASDRDRVTRAVTGTLRLRIPANRLEVRKHFFSQRTPEQWNMVPDSIKMAKTTAEFKNCYKKHRRDQLAAARNLDG